MMPQWTRERHGKGRTESWLEAQNHLQEEYDATGNAETYEELIEECEAKAKLIWKMNKRAGFPDGKDYARQIREIWLGARAIFQVVAHCFPEDSGMRRQMMLELFIALHRRARECDDDWDNDHAGQAADTWFMVSDCLHYLLEHHGLEGVPKIDWRELEEARMAAGFQDQAGIDSIQEHMDLMAERERKKADDCG